MKQVLGGAIGAQRAICYIERAYGQNKLQRLL